MRVPLRITERAHRRIKPGASQGRPDQSTHTHEHTRKHIRTHARARAHTHTFTHVMAARANDIRLVFDHKRTTGGGSPKDRRQVDVGSVSAC